MSISKVLYPRFALGPYSTWDDAGLSVFHVMVAPVVVAEMEMLEIAGGPPATAGVGVGVGVGDGAVYFTK